MRTDRYLASAVVCLLAVALIAWGPGQAGAAGPSDPKNLKAPPADNGPAPDGSLQISPADHCPVCGMLPFKRPRTAAGAVLEDGRSYYFCSNRCLLMTWRYPQRYLGEGSAIARLVVLDYFSGRPLDGSSAWWIAGSDVIGPMGPALVTLQDRQELEAFQRRHGGKTFFKLDQIDDALWTQIMPSDR